MVRRLHGRFLASWDAIEPGLVTLSFSHSKNRVDWCDPGEWRYLLKILLMRLWRLMILLEMMLEVVIGVMVMEVDKVADEVTGMEVIHIRSLISITGKTWWCYYDHWLIVLLQHLAIWASSCLAHWPPSFRFLFHFIFLISFSFCLEVRWSVLGGKSQRSQKSGF